MASIISKRLVTTKSLPRSFVQSRISTRFASQSHSITDSDIASFHSFLESHPSETQLKAFQKSKQYRDVVNHLKNEGATQEDIDGMVTPAISDENMNGGYINPPAIKRSLRDPYEDWWDKQERRNFGEPVHEDNDLLGIFSLEEYNVFTSAQAAKGALIYIASILAVCGIIYTCYPDKPSVPRTFPGGLSIELGGEGAHIAPADVD